MIMTAQAIKLHGRVLMEDGIYVVVVDGTTWCTYHSDGLQALRDVPRMVVDYLNAYEQTGQIEQRLSAMGFDLPLAPELEIEISFDVSVLLQSVAVLIETVPYSVHVGVGA